MDIFIKLTVVHRSYTEDSHVQTIAMPVSRIDRIADTPPKGLNATKATVSVYNKECNHYSSYDVMESLDQILCDIGRTTQIYNENNHSC